MEHSPVSLQSLRDIVLATRGTGAVVITRVPSTSRGWPKRVLDMGSLGVIFPFTSTRELAAQAVASCKYPPLGIRGFGAGLAASGYGMAAADYAKFADENVVVVVIIEQKQAVDDIEAIASVPGIDVLFIGANDLSYSLGVRGRTTEPIVEQAVEKVVGRGQEARHPRRLSRGQPGRGQQADRAGHPVLPGRQRSGPHEDGRPRAPVQGRAPRGGGFPTPPAAAPRPEH